MGQLYAITPFTQLDYPGELACIAWFSGCNLRCVYCHNPDIVLNRGKKHDGELLSFLKRRRPVLTGVVFSGGEATFCPTLPYLAECAKEMGYKTKLDTNGTNPAVLRMLIGNGLIDTIALDYKCPGGLADKVVGTTSFLHPFQESLDYAIEKSRAGKINLEIRTTCHPDLLDEADIQVIIDDLAARHYQGIYWLQGVKALGDKTLGNVAPARHIYEWKKLRYPKEFNLGYRNFSASNTNKQERVA